MPIKLRPLTDMEKHINEIWASITPNMRLSLFINHGWSMYEYMTIRHYLADWCKYLFGFEWYEPYLEWKIERNKQRKNG